MILTNMLSAVFTRAGLDHKPRYNYGETHFLDRKGEAILSLCVREYPSAQTAVIESFTVGAAYRGNGQKIGGTALRHIAAHLADGGIETLELFKVRSDGLTFWPVHGAMPLYNDDLPDVLEATEKALPENHGDRVKIFNALKGRDDLDRVWFDLTDAKNGLARPTLKHINTALSLDQTMVFEFDRPVVRQRLGLGSL